MNALTGKYAKAVLKFAKLNTVAQQREAVTRGRSLLPYRLRYKSHGIFRPFINAFLVWIYVFPVGNLYQ
jgi:hypothetical protein